MEQTKQSIRIYSLSNDCYSFSVNNFHSLKHYAFNRSINPYYESAWEAYKDAKRMLKDYPTQTKIADMGFERDVTSEGDLVVSDISAEDMLTEHYTKLYEQLEESAQGVPEGKC